MRKFRTVQIVGIGVFTPALIAVPAGAATSVDLLGAVQTDAGIAWAATAGSANELLANTLFALSPTEKRKLAGDRIRMSKNNGQAPQQSKAGTKVGPQFRPKTEQSLCTCPTGTPMKVQQR